MNFKDARKMLFSVFELGLNDIEVNETPSFNGVDFEPLRGAIVNGYEDEILITIKDKGRVQTYRIMVVNSSLN
jgi:hypothetical protein